MAEANNDNWIRYGDRSHPNLKLIDEELRYELTYEGHFEDLEAMEEAHLKGQQSKFDELLFGARQMQKIHEGDRTHPRLVDLDSLRENLSYDGWQRDFDEAFQQHLKVGEDDILGFFEKNIEAMKRKQSMSLGNRSHEHLVYLDSLRLSFPGWEKEVDKAVDCHRIGSGICYYKFSLPERQRMFEGDRSHPRLVALDSLSLSYPGWESDVKNAESDHLESIFFYSSGVHDSYREQLNLLSSKQRAHESGAEGWLHPVQSQVLEASWSFPGWQADVEEVKGIDSNASSYAFESRLEKFQLRQMIADNNYREHPSLMMLDELELSYPGWETDFDDALKFLRDNGPGFMGLPFEQRVHAMKNKQAIYFERPKKVAAKKKKEERPVSSVDAAAEGNGVADSGTCVICFEAPRTHAFVPCGHVCACKSCSAQVMSAFKKCPICKKQSTQTMAIYFP